MKNIQEDALAISQLIAQYSLEEKSKLARELSKHNVKLNVYDNPTLVAVALIPVIENYQFKLLGVERGIHPVGGQAFPGGFVNKGETAVIAAARETSEETGLTLNPELFRVVAEHITDKNELLIFCLYTEQLTPALINFDFKCAETRAVLLLDNNSQLCFPLHHLVKDSYFSGQLQKKSKLSL